MKRRKLIFPNGRASRSEISVAGNCVTLSYSDEQRWEERFQVEFPLSSIREVKLLRLKRLLVVRPRWFGILLMALLGVQYLVLLILPLRVASVVAVNEAWACACMWLTAILTSCFICFKISTWIFVETGKNGRLIICTDRCKYVIWFNGQQWDRFADYARRLMSHWRM